MNNFGRISIAALAVLAASSSFAQSSTALNGFTINAGGFYTFDRDLRNATSDFGWMLGLEYKLPTNFMGNGGGAGFVPSIAVTYGQQGSGDRYSFFSAELVGRTTPTATSGMPLYFGGAIGAFFNEGRSGGTSEKATRVGGRIFVGSQVSSQARVEAGFRFSGSVRGTNTNGAFIQVGFNF